jgi:large subunit ribosomal protein L13
VAIHPKKQQAQTYRHWSGYLGGLRTETFAKVMSKDPRKPIIEAVRRMLPKNLLAKHMLSKLKVYVDDKHPHVAQNPEVWRPLGKREAV